MNRCYFCNSFATNTVEEWFEEIKNCNNCKLDIAYKGKWNGCGMESFKRIEELYPNNKLLIDIKSRLNN